MCPLLLLSVNMAEVRQRLGRRAYDFAHKIYSRHLLDSLKKPGKSAIQASPLSAGFLPGDISNGGRCGAETERVTVGASRGSYTRVTPGELAALSDVTGQGHVAGDYYYRGLKVYSLSNKTRVEIIERNLPRCRSYASSRQLCWGHGQFVFTRDYGGNGTRSEPLHKTKTGYYDILEVPPNATQAQVKTAYYKQSFAYHPDRNAGSDEATVRFSEISEAYAVLGNKALRKKYDRGLLSQSDLVSRARPAARDGAGSPARQHTERGRSEVGAASRGAFDFDKFFRSHYSEQLQRERDIRERRARMHEEKQKTFAEKDLDRLTELCIGMLLVAAVLLIFSLKKG